MFSIEGLDTGRRQARKMWRVLVPRTAFSGNLHSSGIASIQLDPTRFGAMGVNKLVDSASQEFEQKDKLAV